MSRAAATRKEGAQPAGVRQGPCLLGAPAPLLTLPPHYSARMNALLERSRSLFSRPQPSQDFLAGPIKGELLGPDGLAERARTLARTQIVRPFEEGSRQTRLLSRLDVSRKVLADAHARLVDAAAAGADVGPAGDWLLDNYHVVEEHIREVRESLPRSYYGELPELAAGSLAGYPRGYEIAITLIGHTEARIDSANVDLFIGAFQEVASLTIGELWAMPAMLRIALIESVRRMALRTTQRLDDVEEADHWAARVIESSTSGSNHALNEFLTAHPPLTPMFVSRFLRQIRLSEHSAPLAWLEPWIGEEGVSAEDAAARANERLALTQVMTANSMTSLRAIGRLDWKTFVERQSALEAVLRQDPAGVYATTTFDSRDAYRHVVERIARRTKRSEVEIADVAIRLAAVGGLEWPSDPARGHVGYYLVDEGLSALEEETRYQPRPREAFHRWVLKHPNVVFIGGIVLGTLAALAAAFWLGQVDAEAGWDVWLLVALFAFIPANAIAIGAVHQTITALLPPRILPKLDLDGRSGIPPEYRTVVLVPTLFGSVDAVKETLERIEVRFLANRQSNLHFAVLSDFTDADVETREDDAAIVDAAVEGVRSLNARYAQGRDDEFFLFHRSRRWNPREGVWMGWERKRGKLAEFNRFARGGGADAFSTIVGDVSALKGVRYAITLDDDTVLPPDSAPLLIGAIAHPLNRAVYDPERGRVVRGFGILQPRVGISLPSAYRSRFATIHSGHPGVDPYTTAVSDLYQDLYGEGSFTGKGIYDIDAFEEATHGRFPENTLLSHDLIEGNYARAALATDIEVFDDYPTRYSSYARRKHRWIRGDWQLLPWLGRMVPGPDGPEPNRLSVLSRWKLLDNLRRSLVEIATVLFLLAGWTILPGSPLRWTILGLLAVAAPWIIAILRAALFPPLDKSWRAYYVTVWHDATTSLRQVAVAITVLANEAWLSVDAIARTLWRMFVSGRHLLQWQTASQVERASTGRAADLWRTMWPSVATGVAAIVIALVRWNGTPSDGRWELVVALVPLGALWIAAPAIVHALSAPPPRPERRLAAARRPDAVRYARAHWQYFEQHVTANTNWLAPDNFQEDPSPVVAMRTSPTNIGLQLLSTVSAHDLGVITLDAMVERLERAFRSMEQMRRFRGHFYNWYDLHDLRVLEPAYVSTVDSGNLAGHLIAVRQACCGFLEQHGLDADLKARLEAVAHQSGAYAEAMDFRFLFDEIGS